MAEISMEQLTQAVETNLRELVQIGQLRAGQMLVIGTSTSEVRGAHIGTSGTLEVAAALFRGVMIVCKEFGLVPAFQCCEHLNRAIVVEGSVLDHNSALEPVRAVPMPKAGGSMAAYAFRHLQDAVLVESVQAQAGIDIGGTLIGMHLRRVAVPVRPSIRQIGEAHVTMAYTRPKLIGGERAVYSLPADSAAQPELPSKGICS
jgi:uncharacterized protein (TIGR01440 family)